MDSATTTEIPLPSEYPGRADPSPASRDPLNSLLCAILDPYRTIEEIAEDRRITVMTLGEILSEEPASSTIESLRKVFALRAEMLALHARASAVGTLTRIANSGKDDEVARRAATTLLRMFRPDGTPAPSTEPRPSGSGPHPQRPSRDDPPSPSSPVTDGGGASSALSGRGGGGHQPDRAPTIADRAPAHAPTEPRPSAAQPRREQPHPTPRSREDRAPDRRSERSESSSNIPAPSGPLPDGRGSVGSAVSGPTSSARPTPHATIPATPTSPDTTPTPPTAPSEPGGAGGAASPSGSATSLLQQPRQTNQQPQPAEIKTAHPSGSAATQHQPILHHQHHRQPPESGRLPRARPPP